VLHARRGLGALVNEAPDLFHEERAGEGLREGVARRRDETPCRPAQTRTLEHAPKKY
jgi:hypothetical protein